ncbi:MAG: hypothetical protein LUC30_01180 [Clostridiales bacterium]|nr:hypothetical protein [Clostridiales bacterium]
MAKYIDADALLDELAMYFSDMSANAYDSQDDALEDAAATVRQAVYDATAADVAPVRHGKWLNTHHTSIVQCSLCGGTVATLWKGYFCQNCGAKMDGGSSHE